MSGYEATESWLDSLLGAGQLPAGIVAIGFNLYEKDQDSWIMEMVGTSQFSLEDESWLTEEVTDFGTKEKPLAWQQASDWKTILAETVLNLRTYLDKGAYASQLKSVSGVGVGFADGDIEILYTND